MTRDGVLTVVRHEFLVRLRTGRWRGLLAAWTVVVGAFMVLLALGLGQTGVPGPHGPPMFGGLMLFVLALALLVAPALTAQSVNGDRERGTLATLQVTMLSAAEIAVGKLLAAWGTACVFLLLTLPFVAWSVLAGGVGLLRALVVLVVVALLLAVVVAVAQALSAVLARSITSALLSYLAVFALTLGTLIAFGLAVAVTTENRTVTETPPPSAGPPPEAGSASASPAPPQRYSYETTVVRPDRVWWLLAPNPFVILADAAPRLPERRDPRTGDVAEQPLDPLGGIGRGVRSIRVWPSEAAGGAERPTRERERGLPVWPYGLAADLALGAGALWLTTRRLRTPSRTLPPGVRVA
jgi:ABC-2 type transport system permease protein